MSFRISLVAAHDVDPGPEIEVGRCEIDAYDCGSWEGVPPHLERVTAPHAQLEQRKLSPSERREELFIDGEVWRGLDRDAGWSVLGQP